MFLAPIYVYISTSASSRVFINTRIRGGQLYICMQKMSAQTNVQTYILTHITLTTTLPVLVLQLLAGYYSQKKPIMMHLSIPEK